MENVVNQSRVDYSKFRNTYHYTISSRNCVTQNDPGVFQFTIPPFPYPDHQGSQLGIFRLKEMYICHQGTIAGHRASGNVNHDPSGFYVSFTGVGFRPQNFTNIGEAGTTDEPLPRSFFFVPNPDGGADNGNSTIYQRISGGRADDLEVPVSNPAGTTITVEVRDVDDGLIIPDSATYFTLLHFTIELVPTSISNGI